MKKILLITIIVTLSLTLWGKVDSNAGEYGFQMLKISSSPIEGALGGTGIFNPNNAFSYLGNASSTSVNNSQLLECGKNMWLFGTNFTNISYINSIGKNGFGVGVRYLDYGKIDSYDETNVQVGVIQPLDLDIIVNYSRRLSANHFVGVNSHILYEELDSSSDLGTAFDLGYTYLPPISGMTVNLALKYFGKTGKMDQEEIKLPVTEQAGISQKFDFKDFSIISELNLLKHKDDDNLKANIGFDFGFRQMLHLRCGYKVNYDLETFSLGMGIKVKKIMINYAYLPIQENLDDVNMISLTYKFK